MYTVATIQDELNKLIFSLPCHINKPYPKPSVKAKNTEAAKLLLDVYAGANAELSALTQYTYHALTIPEQDVSELELCISLVEMYHLQLLGKLITDLGGNPVFMNSNQVYWNGGAVSYGKSIKEKLSDDILSEEAAIAGYQNLLRILGDSLPSVNNLINRIIEDEELHLVLFKQAFANYGGK